MKVSNFSVRSLRCLSANANVAVVDMFLTFFVAVTAVAAIVYPVAVTVMVCDRHYEMLRLSLFNVYPVSK